MNHNSVTTTFLRGGHLHEGSFSPSIISSQFLRKLPRSEALHFLQKGEGGCLAARTMTFLYTWAHFPRGTACGFSSPPSRRVSWTVARPLCPRTADSDRGSLLWVKNLPLTSQNWLLFGVIQGVRRGRGRGGAPPLGCSIVDATVPRTSFLIRASFHLPQHKAWPTWLYLPGGEPGWHQADYPTQVKAVDLSTTLSYHSFCGAPNKHWVGTF
jgi:hypothetical protein